MVSANPSRPAQHAQAGNARPARVAVARYVAWKVGHGKGERTHVPAFCRRFCRFVVNVTNVLPNEAYQNAASAVG